MLLVWFLSSWGITMGMSLSRLFAPVRKLDPFGLLKCPMCFGWWVGLGLSAFLHLGPVECSGALWPSPWTGWLLDAFATSGWCYTVYVVLSFLGSEDL